MTKNIKTHAELQAQISDEPPAPRWLVTGAAGFIGSHLVETLLGRNNYVTGLDNLSSGSRQNLAEVRSIVGPEKWKHFRFVKGDIRDFKTCVRAFRGVDCVLHQAAKGSVPKSLRDPMTFHDCNVNGFLNMLVAARDCGVRRF